MVFSSWLLRAMSSLCTERGGASCASCSAECHRMRVGIVLRAWLVLSLAPSV